MLIFDQITKKILIILTKAAKLISIVFARIPPIPHLSHHQQLPDKALHKPY